ncbi:uncharacterized protein LOC126473796 [Schistocerca serialis cubense]|uniref:uncharacterized protein LOC126473796 n=1 Tax=Schistocerca serialis cubense TaxID=2023355 RepID=UPI00214E6AC1|nr:uncharacterized protein LOC126473796 [Schistocerca serialis cubense]
MRRGETERKRRGRGGTQRALAACVPCVLWVLLASAVGAATVADPAADASHATRWLDQLVTPLRNVSLSQILGRWFEVEEVRNFALQPIDLCETFDFFRSSDNGTVLLNQSLSRGSESFDLKELTVLPDASWMVNRYQVGYKVLDLSADGGFLSLASCNKFAQQCYGVILARDFNVTGRDAELLAAHRGLARAGLNDTALGHRQHPDACSPGGVGAGSGAGGGAGDAALQPVRYDV